MSDFIRTCQECGHKQKAKPPNPNKELTDSYRNSKCKKCHSEALDYGSFDSPEELDEYFDSLEEGTK